MDIMNVLQTGINMYISRIRIMGMLHEGSLFDSYYTKM